MKIFRFILALIFALFVDILITRIFPFRFSFFDPFLIIVVYYGTVTRPVGSMLIGLTTGLVQDAWKDVIFGMNAFRKTLIGYLIALLATVFDLSSFFSRLLTLLGATVLDSLLEAGLLLLRGKAFDPLFFSTLGIKLIGNAIIGSIIFFIMGRIFKRKYSTAL